MILRTLENKHQASHPMTRLSSVFHVEEFFGFFGMFHSEVVGNVLHFFVTRHFHEFGK